MTEPRQTLGARLVRRAILVSASWSRSMLLGVRGVVLDDQHRVFLVRHTYVPGWHFPGGGVEIGETLVRSLERELLEEGNIHVTDTPRLHGMFFNAKLGNRDHVAVYVVRQFAQAAPRMPDYEIAACEFFAIDQLPDGTTISVRNRLDEILNGKQIDPNW